MDVLELPKPVINFLRTMSSEKEKYLLTWDLYGDGNSVTLSLTWKLNNNETKADNNTNISNNNKTPSLPQKSSTIKLSSENSHSSTNHNKLSKKIANNSDSNKFIPPPSAASLLTHKSILSDKIFQSNITNASKSNVKFSSDTIFKNDANRRTRSKDTNYSKIESDHYYNNSLNKNNNNNYNTMKNSNSTTSCLYFPSNKKLITKAKQNKKPDNTISRQKSNSATNLNEDSYDETCNECKHISSTLRIVDYNLHSPVYKYTSKNNVRSIQNLNTYPDEYSTDEEDEEKEFTQKKGSPWIKKKNSNGFNSKI